GLEIPWRSRKLAKARRSQTSVDQGPDRLLVDAHDLVDLDQLAGNIDRGLAQARYVDAVLDRLAVEHQPRDGDHRIAGVGRVPQEALADDAVRDQVLGLRRQHRADDRDLLAEALLAHRIARADRPVGAESQDALEVRVRLDDIERGLVRGVDLVRARIAIGHQLPVPLVALPVRV